MVFCFVLYAYFIYKDPLFGACFVISNMFIFFYVYQTWGSMTEKNEEYETSNMSTENSLLELLNNMDKIIHRGQTAQEMNEISKSVNTTIANAHNFFSYVNNQTIIINSLTYLIIFASIWYMINQFYSKKIDSVFFITFMSIIILYRDRMNIMLLQLSNFIESNGRTSVLFKFFKDMEDGYDDIKDRVYNAPDVDFNKITFDRVSFRYLDSETLIFNDMSVSIETSGNKIIGMAGTSGRGKSTFVKLMLKIYKINSGNIYIDNVNIKDIDPDYIRRNIVYINQSGKLFDKIIVDNMLYGCDDVTCKERLNEIMGYDKIGSLYKNLDLYTSQSGSLGENLSGGQRQVVNVINGLIHPSSILILDEPTNALDSELKKDIINLIRDFKKYKKCIFIITHDSDMDPLFDELLKL